MATRSYEGDGIIVHWDSELCFHSGRCTAGLPSVFDRGRRPWVEPLAASADAITDLVDTCPSGALRYTRTDGAAGPWGPLEVLIGEWEGTDGRDVAYSHRHQRLTETPFRERVEFEPVGPIANGWQRLYGLDYRASMWREGQEDPFHREVGYWLWDPFAGEVTRFFVIPRAIAVKAVAPATRSSTSFEFSAGSTTAAVMQSDYLAQHARSTGYRAEVVIHDNDTWSYSGITAMDHAAHGGEFDHTDSNTLRRCR